MLRGKNPQPKKVSYDTKLHRWSGSRTGDQGRMEYLFIAITTSTTLVWGGNTCLYLLKPKSRIQRKVKFWAE